MGIYLPLWDQPGHEAPRFENRRFRSPGDVTEWVRHDRLIPWKTWPDVWHLDNTGALQGSIRGSSRDGLRGWADRPETPYTLVGA